MNELFAYLFFFLMGFLLGAATFMSFGLYQVRKLKKSKDTLVDNIKKRAQELEQKTASIKDRLSKAAKIAQTQMELRAQAEMPSKNALHSKYKNGIVHEINELELEKIAILKTILDEGFNPMITVIQENGAREDIPLSDYVATAQQSVDAGKTPEAEKEPAPPAPLDDNQPRRVGKFFIYKGGKDDGPVN